MDPLEWIADLVENYPDIFMSNLIVGSTMLGLAWTSWDLAGRVITRIRSQEP